MTLAQNIMVGAHICEPFLFWLPHTAELCLHWRFYLRIPFWPCSLLNILSIFHFLFSIPPKPCTGSNSIIVASVTISKVNNNVFASLGSHVYLWKSTHAHAQIIFNPGLKFQLCLWKPGWKFQPWVNVALGWKFYHVTRK